MFSQFLFCFLICRFIEVDGSGFDKVRRTEIGKKHFKLTHFEEVNIISFLEKSIDHAILVGNSIETSCFFVTILMSLFCSYCCD